jgi:alkylhydroperoxidase/carboxymuconolactone decarboxylase family protein YurZ
MALPPFLKSLSDRDPALAKAVDLLWETAQSGPLDPKTRTLITMALDAAHGAARGVESLANQARAQGASDEEIAQALRLAYIVAGMNCLTTGAAAFPAK